MVAEPELSFAGLLRQLRTEAKLTQEELADATGLSPRSISDLERGLTRTAHKGTGAVLAGALSLSGVARELFVAAARGKALAAEVLAARQGAGPGPFAAAATRALPRDIAAFTGRQAELAQLMAPLATEDGGVVRIHAVDGMAGTGKTTSRCTPRTGWPGPSRTGSSSCRCTHTHPASGRSTQPMRWPASC